MKPDHMLLLQAAATGALLALAIGAASAAAGNDDVAGLAQMYVAPGALSALLATALALRGERRARAGGRALSASAMAGRIVLHLLWILPLLVGIAIGVSTLTASEAEYAGVGGRGFGVVVGLIMMAGAVLSVALWGLPAYLLARWGCSRFLSRSAVSAPGGAA